MLLRYKHLKHCMTKPINWRVPSKDSDQPGRPPSLIRVFAVHMNKAWVHSYPLSRQWRLWSHWVDAEADVFIGRTSFCWFCHAVAHLPAQTNEPEQDKNQQNGLCAQQRLRSVWASTQSDQSSLSAWRKFRAKATHKVHSEDCARLIWVFAELVGCVEA